MVLQRSLTRARKAACARECSSRRFRFRAERFSGPTGITPRANMQLLVRTLAGRTVAVQADAHERVSALKARVVGGQPEAVRLTHAGHELNDAQMLGELHLDDDTVLQAALRLNGGVMTGVKLVTPRHASKSVTVSRVAQPRACASACARPGADSSSAHCAD